MCVDDHPHLPDLLASSPCLHRHPPRSPPRPPSPPPPHLLLPGKRGRRLLPKEKVILTRSRILLLVLRPSPPTQSKPRQVEAAAAAAQAEAQAEAQAAAQAEAQVEAQVEAAEAVAKTTFTGAWRPSALRRPNPTVLPASRPRARGASRKPPRLPRSPPSRSQLSPPSRLPRSPHSRRLHKHRSAQQRRRRRRNSNQSVRKRIQLPPPLPHSTLPPPALSPLRAPREMARLHTRHLPRHPDTPTPRHPTPLLF